MKVRHYENQSPEQLKKRGILEMNEGFYLESIKYAADRALAAFRRFDELLVTGRDEPMLVANIQEAIGHAGNLSLFFWPARDNGISFTRGERLRSAFQLQDDSPLKDRRLRNASEHFDEKLDEYLGQTSAGAFITSPIVGDVSEFIEPIRVFRLVDPHKSAFVILDERYAFGPIREATKNIFDRAERFLQEGGRLPE